MKNLLQAIRIGQGADLSVPRTQFNRLWNWCRRRNASRKISVCVLNSSDYSLRHCRPQALRGRAVPRIRVHARFDEATQQHQVGYTTISWYFVY